MLDSYKYTRVLGGALYYQCSKEPPLHSYLGLGVEPHREN